MNLNKHQREEVRLRYGGHCSYCGHALPAKWHVDHIEAVRRESNYVRGKGFVMTGKMQRPHLDKLDNLAPSCIPCNINKSDLPLELWRKVLMHKVTVLNGLATYKHAKRFGLVQETGARIVFYFETYAARRRLRRP